MLATFAVTFLRLASSKTEINRCEKHQYHTITFTGRNSGRRLPGIVGSSSPQTAYTLQRVDGRLLQKRQGQYQ
jgi:hypothetical protein